jgi:DNA-binding transcriptional LysR family regulator
MKENLNIRMDRVTLRQLRGLMAVGRTGSVSAAAAELLLTPPAVSMQLRQLERTVGLPILERTRTGFVLTEAGRELATTGLRIEATLKEGGEILASIQRREGGRVVVGGVSTAKYFLPRAVATFIETWPGISVRLRIGNRDDIMEALRNYEIDFAVTGRPPADLPIRRAPIGPHPYLVVAPPEHPRAGSEPFPLAALEGETFLMREKGSGTRTVAEGLLGEAGLPVQEALEFGSNESIKQAVMAGLGIAVISGHTVALELAAGRLVTLPIEGIPAYRTWFVTSRKDKRLLPPAEAFWEFLASEGSRFLPS